MCDWHNEGNLGIEFSLWRCIYICWINDGEWIVQNSSVRVNKIQITNACKPPYLREADPSLLDSIRYFQGCDAHVKTAGIPLSLFRNCGSLSVAITGRRKTWNMRDT